MIEIPGYKIVRTLGKGGMATVYLAIQESFEREVALKVVSPTLSEDSNFSERFLREAKIVSKLVHPNIVTVYDVGLHDGQNYLSMEYVPGLDLKQKRRFLSLRQSLQVVKDVAKALDYASRKGYVHRDVKPENIMLNDDDGRAVLMDFGIACIADTASGMTQTGTAIGTPHYMSPEQAKGRQVDSRADIYSLGVVLYLLLTGYVPYDADSAVAVGIKHVSDPIPRLPRHLAPLQPIVDKVLAKEPTDRYQTGAELMAALAALSEGDIAAMERGARDGQSGAAADDTGAEAAGGNWAASDNTTAFNGRASQSPPLSATTEAGEDWEEETRAVEEALAVEEEDRRPVEDEPASSKWPWVLALVFLIALGGAGSVYFKDALPPPMAAAVDTGMATAMEWRDRAFVALGWQTESATLEQQPAPAAGSASNVARESGIDAAASRPTTEPAGASAGNRDMTTSAPETPLQRARRLREELEEDLSVAPQLAQLYRRALLANPGDQQGEWGLQELKDYHFRQLRDALAQYRVTDAATYMSSLETSFPDVNEDSRYQEARADLETLEQAQAQAAEGREYLAQGQLTDPEGANALQAFRRAQTLVEGYPPAAEGIEAIVSRYEELARERLQQGQWVEALAMADRGLELDSDHQALNQLRQNVSEQRQRQRQMDNLLARADGQLNEGKLISPAGESAYHHYRQLLEMDGDHSRARAGLNAVEKQLAYRVERQINRNQFDQARATLQNGRELYPDSERLLGLEVSLEKAIEADFQARQPKVPDMLVSNNKPNSMDQPQARNLRVERTLYIGFRYDNFSRETSVVQAVLYDGSRSVQIAQVPVVVRGKSGVKFFPIERPVEGFAEGGYNIDLLLDQKRLSTLAFKVENPKTSAD